MTRQTGQPPISFRLPPDPARLLRARHRVAQEALDNVVRHAAAPHAWVELDLEPGAGSLTVRDDGRGCDLSTAEPTHLGIRSMEERAAEVGACLRVESTPGAGTTVTLWWPPGAGTERASDDDGAGLRRPRRRLRASRRRLCGRAPGGSYLTVSFLLALTAETLPALSAAVAETL